MANHCIALRRPAPPSPASASRRAGVRVASGDRAFWRCAPQAPASASPPAKTSAGSQQQPLEAGAVLWWGYQSPRRARIPSGKKYSGSRSRQTNNIGQNKLRHREIEHAGDHRHQRSVGPNKAADKNRDHAVLMQRMLGFIQQRLCFLHKKTSDGRTQTASRARKRSSRRVNTPIIPASHACQKFRPRGQSAPPARPSPFPVIISPTSASDSRKATTSTAIRIDRRPGDKMFQQCLHNVPGIKTSTDSPEPSRLRQVINCRINPSCFKLQCVGFRSPPSLST